MGLPKAIQAHGEGNLALAEKHYKRALEQKQYKPMLFQNYGSLLRSNGALEESRCIYVQGLKMFPEHIGINRNYSNFLRSEGKGTEALKFAFKALRLSWQDGGDTLETMYCECIDLLRENNLFQMSYGLLKHAISQLGIKTKFLWRLFSLSVLENSALFNQQQSELILQLIEEKLHQVSPLEKAEFLFFKSFYHVKRHESSLAVDSISEAHKILHEANFVEKSELRKAQKLIDLNSWNASCVLLKTSRFEDAWKLFEYGLRAPAAGPQRWQRSLKKIFTHQELPLWRGSDLSDSRLLLLEEQAIGDTMMFLTLLPTLLKEANQIGIVLSKRLQPIYKRSCSQLINEGRVSIWGHEDVSTGRLKANDFDFQSPVGSICQYRFNHINSFAPKAPVLVADKSRVASFKNEKLLSHSKTLRIGISWRGGGRSDRIKLKSVDSDMMARLMRENSKDILYVNLQYGDVSKVVQDWQSQGLPVVDDPGVNPLKNMEEWLNLVASCDAVISVANTTIHGAGGLNIPTLCLLSQHSDWRWLNDSRVERSYWYSSVGIARESVENGWTPAFKQVGQWISQGCPMPDGPVHTEMLEQAFVRASVT